MSAGQLDAVITAINAEAKDVLSFELADPQGRDLPPFEPGAHLEVYLPNGLIRHYSLCNDFRERDRYKIGVGLSPQSRGGSRLLHGGLKVGGKLRISAPRNNFPLLENGDHYSFIAGGIGITPILAMIHWCVANEKPWTLHYLARSRLRAAFYEELQELGAGNLSLYFLDENGGQPLDIESTVAAMPAYSHIYCCGPAPLMERVEDAAKSRPSENVHFEWFSGKTQETSNNRGFKIILNSTGEELDVPAEKSILEALEDNGHFVPFSCREGLCSSCETRVLSGTPEHRDFVLSDAAKAEGKSMMICVSRAKSDTLELDI
ncbi:PDR/VanB family oxidoreductase [Pseudomonas citronellolis]|uniref:PDR/VanB family oxidoreductase n=1 Tax=Pseudomonas citronellolis TaxID=53408 RepID=UPI000778DEFA|nr:PDR/VanB family oxidoreductase [Pseudomonas citronellolis]AMO76105.1 Phenoxybenzoate dioxygenase subunit beta [Pseudomonas citronellolis]